LGLHKALRDSVLNYFQLCAADHPAQVEALVRYGIARAEDNLDFMPGVELTEEEEVQIEPALPSGEEPGTAPVPISPPSPTLPPSLASPLSPSSPQSPALPRKEEPSEQVWSPDSSDSEDEPCGKFVAEIQALLPLNFQDDNPLEAQGLTNLSRRLFEDRLSCALEAQSIHESGTA
jgi:hypothetical protein